MRYEDAALLLQKALDEEGEADKTLTELAETVVNVEAEEAEEENGGDEEKPARKTPAKKTPVRKSPPKK